MAGPLKIIAFFSIALMISTLVYKNVFINFDLAQIESQTVKLETKVKKNQNTKLGKRGYKIYSRSQK